MKLQYALPVWAETLPGIVPEEVRYCVPYDLTAEGRFLRDGYLAVTRERLFVLEGGRILRDIPLRQGTEIVCSPQVDSGLLLSRQDGEERFLCRFTMRHMVRISYVAKGATQFAAGIDRQVESRERERVCPQCGRVLPGTSVCPRCEGGRGRGFHRFWDLCHGYALPLLLITLMMAVVSVSSVAQQAVQRRFVDDVLVPASGTWGQVASFFLVMLALVVTAIVLNILNTIWSNKLGTQISRDLRGRVFRKLNDLSLSFLGSRQTGELMNRVVEDANRVREFMEQVFAEMFTQLFTMAAALIMMIAINWKMALLALAGGISGILFHKAASFWGKWLACLGILTGMEVLLALGHGLAGASLLAALGLAGRELLPSAACFPLAFLLTRQGGRRRRRGRSAGIGRRFR